MTKTIRKFFTLCAVIGLSACSTTSQVTSGNEYLMRHDTVGTASIEEGKDFEETLRKVAAVEPTLKFPARIGLARIDNYNLISIPSHELKAWTEMWSNLESKEKFGELILVNPLIASMVSNDVKTKDKTITPINQVRLAAARQHLDAVLIYEIQTKSVGKDNFLEVGNLTIIGTYILPSETVEAEGYAGAVLIDVMQGYPYGNTDVFVEKRKGFTTNSESGKRGKEMEDEIATAATLKLAPEVENLFKKVRAELEAKKTKEIAKKE